MTVKEISEYITFGEITDVGEIVVNKIKSELIDLYENSIESEMAK